MLGGSGQGEQLAANKVRGVRAALCNDLYTARLARAHNDANVLSIGARVVGVGLAEEIVDTFLATAFEGGRHARRVAQITDLEVAVLTGRTLPQEPRCRSPPTPNPTPRSSDLLARELERQTTGLQLIASENFTSPAVMRAVGSVLTNKYSEGYPGKRYYGGNAVIDDVEALAIERAKALFGAEHANVQPHSGANANMCVYQALLEPGDTVLGLSLDHGGHLTHGSPVNASGLLLPLRRLQGHAGRRAHRLRPGARPRARAPPEDDRRRHHELPAAARPRAVPGDRRRGRRAVHVRRRPPRRARSPAARTRTRCRIADVVTFTTHKTLRGPRGGCILSQGRARRRRSTRRCSPAGRAGRSSTSSPARRSPSARPPHPSFTEYAHQIVTNASALAEALAGEGFRLVSGGTDNHLMVVDLRPFDAELTGKVAQTTLDEAGITLNKNTMPDDPRSPFVTSGLRIGTPSVTTQGMARAGDGRRSPR